MSNVATKTIQINFKELTMNDASKFMSVLYAILAFGGGVTGFVMAQSSVSLITGAVTGFLIIASLKVYEKESLSAYKFIAAITLILTGFFFFKYINSGFNFFPPGLMFIASFVTFVTVGLSWYGESKKKK